MYRDMSKIGAEKSSLYLLLLNSQIYVTAGFNQMALVESFPNTPIEYLGNSDKLLQNREASL